MGQKDGQQPPETEVSEDLVEQLQVENEQLKEQVIDLQKQLEGQKAKLKSPPKLTDKIRWRKTGGGSFRMKGGRIIKPGQIFEATLDEIPEAFRDIIIPLDELPQETPLISSVKYEIKMKTGGWFNVVESVSGKAMNEKGLRKEDAEKLLADLS